MIKVLRAVTKDDLCNYLNKSFVLPKTLENALFKRQNEFAAGRLCALEGLERLLGNFRFEVGQDSYCRPLWPNGISGSISHSKHYVVSVVAHKHNVFSIGVDVEEISSCANTVKAIQELVITKSERDSLSFANSDLALSMIYLIFSAKESVFKCINPLNNDLFEFKDIEIYNINTVKNSFSVRLNDDRLLSSILGETRTIHGNYEMLFGGQAIYTEVYLI